MFYARLFIRALWSPAGKRADLLALDCGVYCEFVTFPLVSWVRCGWAALFDDWYKRLDNYLMCYTTILAGQDSSFQETDIHQDELKKIDDRFSRPVLR